MKIDLSQVKKIVVAPDSFKGTLSARVVANEIKRVINEKHPQINVVSMPVADGGEGTLDALKCFKKARTVRCVVNGPFMNEQVKADYLISDDTAIIETAKAIGLPLVGLKRNPLITTTYGVGGAYFIGDR